MVRLWTAFPFSNGHVHTVFPVLFRAQPDLAYERQRLDTSDGDFVDLDWSLGKSDRLVLILHGLEGHSRRKYVLGMGRAARMHGFDVLAMNFRGCGGEMNRKLTMYHSGLTQDLHEVLCMVQEQGRYASVDIVGFSLGGNVLLKYLGEDAARIPGIVRRAVAFSVPCDLEDAAEALARPQCAIYVRYLLDQLRKKIMEKNRLFSGVLDVKDVDTIRTFREFDDRFTAPLHGFRNAHDYWSRCSCRQFLSGIDRRTCIINAANDPFLGPKCFPRAEAARHPCLQLLSPPTGGHVGFAGSGQNGMYWSEWAAMRFLCSHEDLDVQKLLAAEMDV